MGINMHATQCFLHAIFRLIFYLIFFARALSLCVRYIISYFLGNHSPPSTFLFFILAPLLGMLFFIFVIASYIYFLFFRFVYIPIGSYNFPFVL